MKENLAVRIFRVIKTKVEPYIASKCLKIRTHIPRLLVCSLLIIDGLKDLPIEQ
jgi:hypothetical protein